MSNIQRDIHYGKTICVLHVSMQTSVKMSAIATVITNQTIIKLKYILYSHKYFTANQYSTNVGKILIEAYMLVLLHCTYMNLS